MISSSVFSKAALLAASALLLVASFAREADAQIAPAPTAAPGGVAHPAAAPQTAPPADVPPEKGLKSRIFTVAHRDPDGLVRILRPLGSGARGAVLSADSGFGTISARDFPENLAVMEEAVKRFDVIEPARADVELKIHVLLASNRPDAAASFPEDLKDVVAALRGTLLYKSYTLVTTFVERARDRARVVTASGVAVLPGPEGKEPPALQIECEARGLTVEPGAAGAGLVRLENFSLSAIGIHGFSGRASVRTDLTLRPGEKVVVGTSSLGDKGLAVVVSASIVK
ncbi:MAG TPA: hypothetical protein VLJ18_07665 [Thermoanaerobaculia bacterium]|nr:hypothetical protein [Thermoanaerobaculia bacterium]